ncbi:MAG: membrane protein insertion efficiency factor YidD [Bacteroidia bacterium]
MKTKNPISLLFIFLVKLYQWIISPILPNSCRHDPTCSVYAIESIKEWGPLKGTWMGMKRLAKCNPWGSSGYDPVQKKSSSNKI